MSYYEINAITSCSKKYGNFLNDYEPYQEIREFRRVNQKFNGFSNIPIIFERDRSYKNNEPISDFLLNDWGEIIVSQRIYDFLKEKYSNEIDFYNCFAKDNGFAKPYYILRAKYEIDVLDRDNSVMIDYGVVKKAFKSILKDSIDEKYNYFAVKDGPRYIISKKLLDELKQLNPTNFEVTTIATTAEELKAKNKKLKKLEKN